MVELRFELRVIGPQTQVLNPYTSSFQVFGPHPWKEMHPTTWPVNTHTYITELKVSGNNEYFLIYTR